MSRILKKEPRTPTKKHEFSFEKKKKIIEKPIDILSLRVYIRRVDKIKEGRDEGS